MLGYIIQKYNVFVDFESIFQVWL